MHFEGVVKKMTTEKSHVVNYFIEFENSFIHVNQFLDGREQRKMLSFQI